MIRGEEGNQARELVELIAWLKSQPKPDVVILSNALLVGMARRLKAELQVPVACFLSGEDTFLDALPESVREETWRAFDVVPNDIAPRKEKPRNFNRVRSAGRRAEATSTDLDESAFEAALAQWVPTRSPAEEVERWQLGEQLVKALDGLPAELRGAVWLVDVEGFTQREAAGMQDVPEGTIASRLFRGRRQLRAALERPAREAKIWRNL